MAAAPRYARPFVGVFITTLVVCALAPLNLWPFSNWELFSRLRTATETSWEAVAVTRSGQEDDYPIAAIPIRARNTDCAAWLRGTTAPFGKGTRLVRVYEVERLLSHREGTRAAPSRRTLAWTCTAKGPRES